MCVSYRVGQHGLELLQSFRPSQLVPLPTPLLLLRRATHLNLPLPLLQTGLDTLLPLPALVVCCSRLLSQIKAPVTNFLSQHSPSLRVQYKTARSPLNSSFPRRTTSPTFEKRTFRMRAKTKLATRHMHRHLYSKYLRIMCVSGYAQCILPPFSLRSESQPTLPVLTVAEDLTYSRNHSSR